MSNCLTRSILIYTVVWDGISQSLAIVVSVCSDARSDASEFPLLPCRSTAVPVRNQSDNLLVIVLSYRSPSRLRFVPNCPTRLGHTESGLWMLSPNLTSVVPHR